MRQISAIICALFLALASACAWSAGETNLSSEIFRHWTHSREEDTANAMVFRTSEYPFPRARGRKGFEIKQNGEFIEYQIGPDDRPLKLLGHWKYEGNNEIVVEFVDPTIRAYTLKIISVKHDILEIQRRPR